MNTSNWWGRKRVLVPRESIENLVKEIPVVLRADFSAVAALAGAAVVVAGHLLHWPPAPTTIAGASVCFFMRLTAIRRGWRLPVANDDAGHPSATPE